MPSAPPLRPVRARVDEALRGISRRFSAIYAEVGRPSIRPERLLRALLDRARKRRLLSPEHFSVDGTLVEAWASHKSFVPKREGRPNSRKKRRSRRGDDDQGNPTVDFRDHRITLGGDLGFGTRDFVAGCRERNVAPHTTKRTSRIDLRTTRHAGYGVRQRRRKVVEEVFGWMKTVGLMRKLRHRGTARVGWVFTFTAAAYDLVRMRNLGVAT